MHPLNQINKDNQYNLYNNKDNEPINLLEKSFIETRLILELMR